jgi:hypothetical protein
VGRRLRNASGVRGLKWTRDSLSERFIADALLSTGPNTVSWAAGRRGPGNRDGRRKMAEHLGRHVVVDVQAFHVWVT